jgi:hypothetical protein
MMLRAFFAITALFASNLVQAQDLQPQNQPNPGQLESTAETLARYRGVKGTFKCHDRDGVNFIIHFDVDKASVRIIREGETLEYINGRVTKGSLVTDQDQVSLHARAGHPTRTAYLRWGIFRRNGEMVINTGEGGTLNLATGEFQAFGEEICAQSELPVTLRSAVGTSVSLSRRANSLRPRRQRRARGCLMKTCSNKAEQRDGMPGLSTGS